MHLQNALDLQRASMRLRDVTPLQHRSRQIRHAMYPILLRRAYRERMERVQRVQEPLDRLAVLVGYQARLLLA